MAIFLIIIPIILWILYRFKEANRIMKKWLIDNNFTLINKKYYLYYRINDGYYSPYQQFLYDIVVHDNSGTQFNKTILIGHWFWGLLKEEVIEINQL